MNQFKSLLFFAFCTLFLFGCKSKTEITAVEPKTEVFKLVKTECYGTCPVYKLFIYSDYSCTIVPKSNVHVKLKSEGILSKKTFNELLEEANQINFWGYLPSYNNEYVTDLPSTYITVTQGNKTHTVHSRMGTPPELVQFIRNIEKTVETTAWKAIEKSDP